MTSSIARRLGSLLLGVNAATCVLAAQGSPVSYIYDDLGRLVAVIDGTGASAVYTYDAVGNLLSIVATRRAVSRSSSSRRMAAPSGPRSRSTGPVSARPPVRTR
ncbi:MAG: RHS repeat domain-containing protein [Vicinamibacterales bacterium]